MSESWDWSPGDVIHAYEDGTIVLDDSITTYNPARAVDYFLRRAQKRLDVHDRRGLPCTDHIRDEITSARKVIRGL